MQIHNVYFWLKEGVAGGDIEAIEEGLRSLTEVDMVHSGHFGKPAATRKRAVVDNGYSYGLVLRFADVAAHDRYQVSEVHRAFVEKHSEMFDRVQVYDIQV